MRKALLIASCLIGSIGLASASTDFFDSATAAPGATPDGVNQLASPVNVWTVGIAAGIDGSGGAYYGIPGDASSIGGTNSWQIYSSNSGSAGDGGSAYATNTFLGGALAVGQTVSINFYMTALDTGVGHDGVDLLNGSATAINFNIVGGGSGYVYTDAGSTAASAGSMTYQYESAFNIAFTVTSAGHYSALCGSDSWTGTYNGSLTGFEVYNQNGGNESDLGFNDYEIVGVPEPGTLALVSVGATLLLLGCHRRKALRA